MEPLDEKDFIQERRQKTPVPLWLWFMILVAIFISSWMGGEWVIREMQTRVEKAPFLRVTNRQISLYLWQNPQYMRVNVRDKTGYLPAFQTMESVSPQLEQIDSFTQAPPELLFQYHTWKRLLGEYAIPKPIPMVEFKDFLAKAPEWDPKHWPDAPLEYQALVNELDTLREEDLQRLPYNILPREVRQAFSGWKNYYIDQEKINQFKPTYQLAGKLIEKYPHYSRNYWQNLYPDYLKSLQGKDKNVAIAPAEMEPFLRVALFNFADTQ